MDAAKETILVVDDAAANRTLITEILTTNGRKIVTAVSGDQALACVAEELPDLILLDLMMPGMNGLEVLRRLKDDAATAKVPVIIVTALDDRETMTQALESGADEVLSKPVNAAELTLRVKNMLRLHEFPMQRNQRHVAAKTDATGKPGRKKLNHRQDAKRKGR